MERSSRLQPGFCCIVLYYVSIHSVSCSAQREENSHGRSKRGTWLRGPTFEQLCKTADGNLSTAALTDQHSCSHVVNSLLPHVEKLPYPLRRPDHEAELSKLNEENAFNKNALDSYGARFSFM